MANDVTHRLSAIDIMNINIHDVHAVHAKNEEGVTVAFVYVPTAIAQNRTDYHRR